MIKNFEHISRNNNSFNKIPFSCPRTNSIHKEKKRVNTERINDVCNYFTTYNENQTININYQRIVNDILGILKKNIGIIVNPEDLPSEIQNIVTQYIQIKEKEENLRNINHMNDKYLRNLKKMLSEQPESNLKRRK